MISSDPDDKEIDDAHPDRELIFEPLAQHPCQPVFESSIEDGYVHEEVVGNVRYVRYLHEFSWYPMFSLYSYAETDEQPLEEPISPSSNEPVTRPMFTTTGDPNTWIRIKFVIYLLLLQS